MIIPTVVGPIMAGVIFDTTGTYDLAFAITLVLLTIALGGFALASPPGSPASSALGDGDPQSRQPSKSAVN